MWLIETEVFQIPQLHKHFNVSGNLMGTDLITIGNHKINFKGKKFNEVASEIKFKLDNINFTNADFLHQSALSWNRDNYNILEKIETKKDWTYEEESQLYSSPDNIYLEFYGPHDLELNVEQHFIYFHTPIYRYRQWFELKNEDGTEAIDTRNKWRKYMHEVLQTFGGDRVIYLADNSHPLDKYMYLDCSFEEIEAALRKDFGEPKKTFKEVTLDYNHSYFIDTFENIN